MTFGKKVKELREEQNWNRTELAEKIGVSHVMVGRYERDETAPSIEVARKMANVLGTSIDYLVGQGVHPTFDKKTLQRLAEIQEMPNNLKEKMWFFIDTVIRDFKTKQTYS